MSSKPDAHAAGSGTIDEQPAVEGETGLTQTPVTPAEPAGDAPSEPPPAPATPESLEVLVRRQLAKALGGTRGMIESAIPTAGFTLCWVLSHNLRVSLVLSGGLAIVLLAVRIVQRSSVQFVLNSLFGIGVAAVFALRSGRAADAFLPGVIYNAIYAVVLAGSALVRWPLIGFMIGSVTGDPTGWHKDTRMVKLCGKLTYLLALPCVLRVLVQYPLYRLDQTGWLGVAKLVMGWPLQVAALATMVWVLSRDETKMAVAPVEPSDADS